MDCFFVTLSLAAETALHSIKVSSHAMERLKRDGTSANDTGELPEESLDEEKEGVRVSITLARERGVDRGGLVYHCVYPHPPREKGRRSFFLFSFFFFFFLFF